MRFLELGGILINLDRVTQMKGGDKEIMITFEKYHSLIVKENYGRTKKAIEFIQKCQEANGQ
jgi:hypothetical protein